MVVNIGKVNMDTQLALIHQRNTWLHFIGGYYSSTDKFIDEAIKSRISRRAPALAVRCMKFGDRLVLLRYAKQGSHAFAECEIIGITLDHEIAKEVGERLKEEGKAEYHDAGNGEIVIQRECGSYLLCGGWTVTCELSEVMDIALEIAKEKKQTLFVMVNAELTKIYESPIYLQPSPKFTRGFTKAVDDAQYFTSPQPNNFGRNVFSIANYSKA